MSKVVHIKLPPTHNVRVYRTERKKQFVRELKENITEAEKILKIRLHKSRSDPKQIRFKFQYIVLGFILDFYFPKAKVCIEVDGGYHLTEQQKIKDQQRTTALNKIGIKVIRFTNDEVINKTDWVLNCIWHFLAINLNDCPEWLKEYRQVK